MADKRFALYFKLPELVAAHAEQVCSVDASSIGLAIKRGFDIIKKRPAVKGRRITEGKISFVITGKNEEDD